MRRRRLPQNSSQNISEGKIAVSHAAGYMIVIAAAALKEQSATTTSSESLSTVSGSLAMLQRFLQNMLCMVPHVDEDFLLPKSDQVHAVGTAGTASSKSSPPKIGCSHHPANETTASSPHL